MARTLRFLPKDPGTTVAPGWCFTQPGAPPTECSWCGKATETIGSENTARWCVLCDEPRPPDTWGADPQDTDFDEED